MVILDCSPPLIPCFFANGTLAWAVEISDAILILRLHGLIPDQPAHFTHFNFFALSAEIRQRILSLVVLRPAMSYSGRVSNCKIETSSRDPGSTVSMQHFINNRTPGPWPSPNGRFFAGTPREVVHALLANRQLYREVMPLFYYLNNFVFLSLADLDSFLDTTQSCIPPSFDRKLCIRSIAFEYSWQEVYLATVVFNKLAALVELRKVFIGLNNLDWEDPELDKTEQHDSLAVASPQQVSHISPDVV